MDKEIVYLKNNKPNTNSVIISDKFGRAHKHVLESLRSLEKSGHLSEPEFRPTSYKDVQGKKRPMIELTERGFLIAMPFIGGSKSKDGQVVLVDGFLKLREQGKTNAAINFNEAVTPMEKLNRLSALEKEIRSKGKTGSMLMHECKRHLKVLRGEYKKTLQDLQMQLPLDVKILLEDSNDNTDK